MFDEVGHIYDQWYDYLIVGSGISGLIAAYKIAKTGGKVALIERAPILGGMIQGFEWENTHCDYGCHLFGNDQDETTELITEILDGQLSPVDLNVASHYQGRITQGFELPDLTALPDNIKQAFLAEKNTLQLKTSQNLAEWIISRFGPTLEPTLSQIVEKVFLIKSSELAAESSAATPFKRLRLFDEPHVTDLKKDPYWDDRLATRPAPTKIPRAFYPKETGLSFFLKKAREKLEQLGVTIQTGCQLVELTTQEGYKLKTADQTYSGKNLIWTAGLSNLAPLCGLGLTSAAIENQIYKVPMVLYYFVYPRSAQGNLAYIQNFDPASPIFRISSPSFYGDKNTLPDQAYICVEVPTEINQTLWNRPENEVAHIWDKALAWGMVKKGTSYLKAMHKKTPVSYKLPRAGYAQASQPILNFVQEQGIIIGDEWAFTKGRLLQALLGKVKQSDAA